MNVSQTVNYALSRTLCALSLFVEIPPQVQGVDLGFTSAKTVFHSRNHQMGIYTNKQHAKILIKMW